MGERAAVEQVKRCCHGHLFTEANTGWVVKRKGVYRRCRTCEAIMQRGRRDRHGVKQIAQLRVITSEERRI